MVKHRQPLQQAQLFDASVASVVPVYDLTTVPVNEGVITGAIE